MNAPPHSLPSQFPTVQPLPLQQINPCSPMWSIRFACVPLVCAGCPLAFLSTEQNVFLHSWTIAGRPGNCHLSWISWVQSCPGKPSLGFFMPLGLSSLFLHLSPSEVQHRGKQEEPAQHWWGCADLLLQEEVFFPPLPLTSSALHCQPGHISTGNWERSWRRDGRCNAAGTCSHLSFSVLKGDSSKQRNPGWECLSS